MKGLPISAAKKTHKPVDSITYWKGPLYPRLAQLAYRPLLSATDSVLQ